MIRLASGLLFAATALHCAAENPPGIPADFRLLYAQDFSNPDANRDFIFTNPAVWSVTKEGGKDCLELKEQSKYEPPFRSPVNIALLADKAFGDVIFEADCQQTSKEYGHRDMVFVYGYQSPTKFYYTHISTSADDHAHNCFVVNDAPRAKFAREVTKGVDWGRDAWHHVRIERKASDGTVRVFFDDMEKPIMTAQDKTFGPGAIGFGSFDDTGRVANFKVWGAAFETRKTEPFVK